MLLVFMKACFQDSPYDALPVPGLKMMNNNLIKSSLISIKLIRVVGKIFGRFFFFYWGVFAFGFVSFVFFVGVFRFFLWGKKKIMVIILFFLFFIWVGCISGVF